jgi:hypothetical protein
MVASGANRQKFGAIRQDAFRLSGIIFKNKKWI